MPNVNYKILSWTREKAGLSLAGAARQLDIDVKDLLGYEYGLEQPSSNLLRKMGRVYDRPLLTFYLRKRPEKYRMIVWIKSLSEWVIGAIVIALGLLDYKRKKVK